MIGKKDDRSLEAFVKDQFDFVESGEFGRRLGEVLKRLPGCKTIWCGETALYPRENLEKALAERELNIKLSRALLWRRPGPASPDKQGEADNSEIKDKKVGDNKDKRDDDSGDEGDDNDFNVNDKSSALIGRRGFCAKLKINWVGKALEDPAPAFKQKTAVEVMGAVLSSKIELIELRFCPQWGDQWLYSSSLQEIVDISKKLASRVHGRDRPRQAVILKTLFLNAEAQAVGETASSDGESVSKQFFKLLPGLIHLRYRGACPEIQDSEFRMLIP